MPKPARSRKRTPVPPHKKSGLK